MEKKFPWGRALSIALFLIGMFVISFDGILEGLKNSFADGITGPFAFMGSLVIATVVAPVAVIPLIPAAGAIFGPFTTGVLSVLGWSAGSVIAFWISRRAGKPLISRLVPEEALKKFEARLPKDADTAALIALRMVIPVDIMSYGLGLFTSVSFRQFLYTTVIGVAPFSFIFAYGGEALASRSFLSFLGIALLGVVIWFAVSRQMKRRTSPQTEHKR